MSWFKVDDTAHTHPKLRSAGTAAIGLWTLGGSYAAQYLTDGVVHAHFAKTTATAPQLAKLVKAGLWHPAGHGCTRCPQPADGDYQIHDYLDYNPSRAGVLAERERAAEKKRRQRAGGDSRPDSDANRDGNRPDSKTIRDRFEDESKTKKTGISDVDAGQGAASPGDSLGTSRARVNPTRPDPVVSPEEKQPQEELASYEEPARIGDRPRIPVAAQPLVDALQSAGLIVGWDLQPNEWFLVEALIKRCGIPALVISARGSWQGARTQPRSGTYFIPAWRQLTDAPAAAEEPVHSLPAAVGDNIAHFPNPGHRPATTDARVQQAIETGRRLQALADAKRNQEQQ